MSNTNIDISSESDSNEPNTTMAENEVLFPKLLNRQKYELLQCDSVGKYSISRPDDATFIRNLISYYCMRINLFDSQITVTDATAGVGGNTISFLSLFKYVNAVEFDSKRSTMLTNNITVYDFPSTKYTVLNDSYINVYKNLTQHVVFIDPPWGGKGYRKKPNITLELGGVPLEQLVTDIFAHTSTKIVVLKVPTNYNVAYFQETISHSVDIHMAEKNKMIILVVLK